MANYWTLAGDREKTLSLLERAIAEQDAVSNFYSLKGEATWDWLRPEPRFQVALRYLKLAD